MRKSIERCIQGGTTAHPPARPAPQTFWRTYPAEAFDEVRRLEIACHLATVSASDHVWRDALAGDAACAVAIGLEMKIPTDFSYPVDLRMTVLLGAALGGSAGCALVLHHMILKMPLDSGVRGRLATSWLVRNLQSARSALKVRTRQPHRRRQAGAKLADRPEDEA